MKLVYKTKTVGGDTSADYPTLVNKPKLNEEELVGNLTTEQAHITWYGTQDEYDALEAAGTINQNTIYIIDNGTATTTGSPTGDYLDLSNKPSINGQILTGNKTSADLTMYTIPEIDNMFASMRSIKVVTALPAVPTPATMYYVGPDADGNYHVYLYDSAGAKIDMGTTSLYTGKNGIVVDSLNFIRLENDGETVLVDAGTGKVKVPTMIGATTAADGKAGLVPAPSAGDNDNKKFLKADGTWEEVNLDVMTGATASAAGKKGLVPAPAAGDQDTKFLKANGTWAEVATMTAASASAAGKKGLVPAPAAGDNEKTLRGDGTWVRVPKITVSSTAPTGASAGDVWVKV